MRFGEPVQGVSPQLADAFFLFVSASYARNARSSRSAGRSRDARPGESVSMEKQPISREGYDKLREGISRGRRVVVQNDFGWSVFIRERVLHSWYRG